MLRSAAFGEPGANAAIARWLAANPDADKGDRARLAHRLCVNFGALSMNAAAADACALGVAAGADDRQDADMWAALRNAPSLRVRGTARLPLVRTALGIRSTTVTVNDVGAPWIVDSGAEITVVSQSLAQRIGVRVVGDTDIDSATGDVQGGLGIVDLLRIGDAVVENVPVFVLPDAQLTFADLPPIQAILGLPVMVGFHRVAWLDQGRTLVLGEALPGIEADDAHTARLTWNEDGVGVPVSTARGIGSAHLDTGANESSLRAAAHALLDPATEATGVIRDAGLGGAAGIIAVRRRYYPRITLNLAGAPVALADVAIDDDDQGGIARLGDDVVAQLRMLALDFDRMTVTVAR